LHVLKVEDVLTRGTQLDKAAKAFSEITNKLISEKKSQGGSPYLDVVGNVINLIPGRWLSEYIVKTSCVLPMRYLCSQQPPSLGSL
jgi:hypothetical protein